MMKLKPSSENKNRPTTKIKVKISSSPEKNSNNHDGIESYMQGYDRELDSDPDEPMSFEEQFILKMPSKDHPITQRLREIVETRKDIENEDEEVNVFLKFLDSRRGIFNLGKQKFGMKLVDLPCVIESQKTFDHRHVFKVADICQMILVDDTPIADESLITQGNFNIEDFIYPHGLTPPLHHVRKRRFRKRLNKRTIETVERAVERLLEEDSKSDQVIIDIVDNVRDLSDSEGEDYRPPQLGHQPGSKIVYNKLKQSSHHPLSSSSSSNPFKRASSHQPNDLAQASSSAHHHLTNTDHDPQSQQRYSSQRDDQSTAETPMADSIGAPTPAGEGEEYDYNNQDYDDEGSIDSDLAAEIEAGLREGAAAEERAAAGLTGPEDGDEEEEGEEDSEDLFGNGDEEEEEEEEDEEEEDDDDEAEENDEMVEEKQRVRLLQGELKDLESAINRKKSEISKAANIILKRRFEEALKKLNLELESKKTQLNTIQLNLMNAKENKKRREEEKQEEEEEEDQEKEEQKRFKVEINEQVSNDDDDDDDDDDHHHHHRISKTDQQIINRNLNMIDESNKNYQQIQNPNDGLHHTSMDIDL